MSKKKDQNDAVNMSPEQLEKTRMKLVKDMRERFNKWMEVYDEEATSDDVNAAKKEFDEEVAKYSNNTYVIIEDENAIEYANLLKEWNTKYNTWEKGTWKGVIMFDKIITEVIDKINNEGVKKIEFDYSTLMYLYQTMSTPTGTGLESAKAMAEFEKYDFETNEIGANDNFVTYSHILQNIIDHVRNFANVDKKLKLMRERINIATAGIKFDWKITELEEFIELHDEWIGAGVPEEEKLAQM